MFWLIGPCAPWWFGGDVQGSCAGQTRDRGRLEFCCRPPRLYGTAWLAHRPCRRTLGCLQDCSRHTGSAYSGTQLPTSNKTAAHQLLVLQIKHKAQSTNSRFWVRHSHPQCARFAPPTSGQHCTFDTWAKFSGSEELEYICSWRMFSPDLYSSCLEHRLIFHYIIVWLLWLTPTPSICQTLYCYMSDTFGKLRSCALVRPYTFSSLISCSESFWCRRNIHPLISGSFKSMYLDLDLV